MKHKKNRQYNRTLKKVGKAPNKPLTKEQADGVIQSMRIALEAVMGAIQLSIELSKPRPKFDAGGKHDRAAAMVNEMGGELIVRDNNQDILNELANYRSNPRSFYYPPYENSK